MIKNLLKYIKHKFPFLAVFGFSKIAVYLVPLWLADILSKYNYGVLEYALAGLGMLIAAGFSLGVPNAYPYFILRKKDLDKEAAFSIHPLWLLLIFIINQLNYFIFHFYDLKLYLALNFAYIVANQQFYSTKLKSKESILKAVLIDSGIYFTLLFFIVITKLKNINPTISSINNFMVLYALIYLIYSVYSFVLVDKKVIFYNYKKILSFSYHLLISSILIFSITIAGRILTEYFFGTESVGVYGFYYRLAAIVVVIHQVTGILFFRKIYTFNPVILDKYFSVFFIVIYTLSITFYFISPFIIPLFSKFYTTTFLDNKLLYLILSAQMVMWIASALNSSIIDRENLAKNNNLKFILLIISGLVIIYFIKNKLTLPLLVFIHFTIFYLATMIQYFSLYKKKIMFKKSFFVLTFIYFFSILLFYIYVQKS